MKYCTLPSTFYFEKTNKKFGERRPKVVILFMMLHYCYRVN